MIGPFTISLTCSIPGCVGDMVLKGVLYYFAARLHVQSVYLRIYVIYYIQVLTAFFIKDEFHFVLVFNVSGVNHRCLESQASYHFSIVNGRVSFSVVDSAGYEYQIWIYFFYAGQVSSS